MFNSNNLRGRLFRGVTLNFLAVVFNQGSTFFASIIVARILLKQGFGEYAIIQSTLQMLAILAQLTTAYTVLKFVSEYRSTDILRSGRIIGASSLVAFVMATSGAVIISLLAPWIADTALNSPNLSSGLISGIGFFFFSVINGYQTGALSGLEAYKSLAKAGAISGLSAVTMIAIGAWIWELNGALVGLSIGASVRCAIHFFYLNLECKKSKIKPIYRGSLALERETILNFVLPTAIISYYSIPLLWFANSLLFRQPNGYGETALYMAALNIKNLILFIPNIINNVVFSILNNLIGINQLSKYRKLVNLNVKITFLATFTGGLIIALFSNLILGLYGENFIDARKILALLLISAVFEATSGAIYQTIQTRGRIWLSLFTMNIPVVLIFVISSTILVPQLSGIGLAISCVIMSFSQLIITKILDININK